jgi:outer membrane immunogenic protein
MPIRSVIAILLRLMTFTAAAMALSLPTAAQFEPKAEVAFEYNYVHSNAPPSGCGCFSMNGGGASGTIQLHGGLIAVAQFSAAHASNIARDDEDLTLTSYLVGPRYTYRTQRRLAPFGEVLVGLSHASGGLSPSNAVSGASSSVFAAAIGGGLDFNVGRRVGIRVVRADYFVTTFANRADDHQNNLRLGTGVAFYLGR